MWHQRYPLPAQLVHRPIVGRISDFLSAGYDDYTVKIKELEKKLADYEDKWYAKFAAMETALAKMQNNASAVTSLLGG